MGLQHLASLSLGRRFRICSAFSTVTKVHAAAQRTKCFSFLFLKCSRRPKAGHSPLLSSKDRLTACIMHVVCNNLCCLSSVYCHCASIRYTRTLRASQSARPGSRLLHAKTNVHRYNSIFLCLVFKNYSRRA